MEKTEVWHSGANNFIEKKLVTTTDSRNFTFTIQESDFEPNRDILDIYYDHLKNRDTKTVEVLYSGGADSELALVACLKFKIPVEAVTMAIQVRGALINVHDLYYSEKFCRENGIKHRLYTLNIEDMYYNGRYKEYIEPYNIIFSHVASQFWIIEQCNSFPIIGGDWPWIKVYSNPRILSPQRLDYNCYDKFMRDKGITGIGSMVLHSFESCYRFMQLQLQHSNINEQSVLMSSFLKQKMYNLAEPRLRSYGWEDCPQAIFDVKFYDDKKFKYVEDKIVWGDKIKNLVETTEHESNKFEGDHTTYTYKEKLKHFFGHDL